MTLRHHRPAAGIALLQATDFQAGAAPRPLARIGVVANRRAYRNKGAARPVDIPQAVVYKYEPGSRGEIIGVLEALKAAEVEMIAVDGGDGTVREVLGAANQVYGGRLPPFAVIPSGKTNALALDLGLPRDWQLGDAIRAFYEGHLEPRSPVRVHWTKGTLPDQLGFILGLGAFNRATMLAQRVHKRGWFNGAAVFFTLLIGLSKAIFGGASSSWRRGDMICMAQGAGEIAAKRVHLIIASTLRRMPIGLKPFGPMRDGLKFLIIDAPPKALHLNALRVIGGSETPRLAADGYHQVDADSMTMQLSKNVVLDGEQFPGGHIVISRAAPVQFVVPGPR